MRKALRLAPVLNSHKAAEFPMGQHNIKTEKLTAALIDLRDQINLHYIDAIQRGKTATPKGLEIADELRSYLQDAVTLLTITLPRLCTITADIEQRTWQIAERSADHMKRLVTVREELRFQRDGWKLRLQGAKPGAVSKERAAELAGEQRHIQEVLSGIAADQEPELGGLKREYQILGLKIKAFHAEGKVHLKQR